MGTVTGEGGGDAVEAASIGALLFVYLFIYLFIYLFFTFVPNALEPSKTRLKGQMNQNLDIFSFESNVFIKYKRNIFLSFKLIGRSIVEILEC